MSFLASSTALLMANRTELLMISGGSPTADSIWRKCFHFSVLVAKCNVSVYLLSQVCHWDLERSSAAPLWSQLECPLMMEACTSGIMENIVWNYNYYLLNEVDCNKKTCFVLIFYPPKCWLFLALQFPSRTLSSPWGSSPDPSQMLLPPDPSPSLDSYCNTITLSQQLSFYSCSQQNSLSLFFLSIYTHPL